MSHILGFGERVSLSAITRKTRNSKLEIGQALVSLVTFGASTVFNKLVEFCHAYCSKKVIQTPEEEEKLMGGILSLIGVFILIIAYIAYNNYFKPENPELPNLLLFPFLLSSAF